MQADNIIPDAGNSQAFDRYAYVLNNPVNYTDPSGNDYCDSRYADPVECAAIDKNGDGKTDTPVLPTIQPDGLTDDGSAAFQGMTILSGIAGKDLTVEEWLAFIIATEYLGTIGNDPAWNAAMARRYHAYCSDGPYSAACFNGFWGYMQAVRKTDTSGPNTIMFNKWVVSPKDINVLAPWKMAKEIANAILNPWKSNNFGINSSMNTCTGYRCDWVLITSTNSLYERAIEIFNSVQNGNKYWWIKSSSDGYDLLLTVDQVKELCGGNKCNLADK